MDFKVFVKNKLRESLRINALREALRNKLREALRMIA